MSQGSHPLPPKTVIGDGYVVGACLHSAAHGGLYRAQSRWGGSVILTVSTPLHPSTPTGAKARQVFVRQARLLMQVQHLAVAAVVDLIDTPEQVTVVQEDRLKQTLAERLTRLGAVPAEHQEVLCRALLGGLAAAHAQALFHGQITPGHVWFDGQGQPVLSGFGLYSTDSTVLPATLPDPRYAAPELLSGGAITPQTDVYGLAATLLEAVTGRAPPPSTARLQGVPLPPFATQASPAVRAGLLLALHPHPAERAVGVREVLETMNRAPATPVEAVATPEPVIAPPVGASILSAESAPTIAPPSAPHPAATPAPSAPAKRPVPWLTLGIGAVLVLGLGAVAIQALSPPATQLAQQEQAQPQPVLLADSGENASAVTETALNDPAPAEDAAELLSVPAVPSEPPAPTVLRTDLVSAALLNLRAEPLSTAPILDTLTRGQPLDVLEIQAEWLRVGIEGKEGWVSAKHTLPLMSPEVTAEALLAIAAGGDVTLDRGAYRLDVPLTVTQELVLSGQGETDTLLLSDAATDTLILEEATVTLSNLSIVHVGSRPARTLLQEGGSLNASNVLLGGAVRDEEAGEFGSGLWVQAAGQATLREVTFTGNAYGLYVSGTAQIDAERSVFSGNSEGGALFKDSAGGEVRSSTFASNGAHGVHLFGQTDVTLTNNQIQTNKGRGVTVYGDAAPSLNNNTIEENTLQGIGVQGSAQPTMTDNVVQGNRQSGVAYFDNAGGEASGNTVQANTKGGFSLTEYAQPTLSRNIITRNRQNGISYADFTSGEANSNTISNNGNPGISVWGDAQPILNGNTVEGNKQSGVVIAERSAAQVTGNTITGNALYGLIITGSAAPQVNDNEVSQNGRGGIFYKQDATGSGSGNSCSGNGGSDFSAELTADSPGPQYEVDDCLLY
ncbi:right-handed parallel beta-helix repeat-containing protein [Deinococcus sp. QL22]|uniref:right-handed parallel beta-helix repeat-containing protein n=1 Tax=Deinococcus sp. QL22 TaxID=2939437 RepID=UPI002016F94D|nr:right-handed parallel beta-helix repeat-containing protein [Deinococcus sp. QL22]UQN08775.1 right-handed parallel beta-helix repeat-containing protein [Deinococcus sp. QL22]